MGSKSKRTLVFHIPLLLLGWVAAGPGSPAFTQRADTSHSVYFIPGLRVHVGSVIPNSDDLKNSSSKRSAGFQADFNWHLNTQKAYDFWQTLPRLGISIYYSDYLNPKILGKSIAVMAYAEPFLNIYHRLNISIRVAMGPVFLSNPFDSTSNPENLAYSSTLSNSLLLSLNAYYQVSKHVLINTSLNYNHISNGGLKQPNKGLNYPNVSMGIEYSPKNLIINRYRTILKDEYYRKNRILLTGLVGFKGLMIDDKIYNIFGLITKYLFHPGKQSYITAGLEFNIDQTKIKESEIDPDVHPNDRYILAVGAGYEHHFGRFGLTFDLGTYLRNPDLDEDAIYQRIGLKFFTTKKMFIGVFLKNHRHHVEFWDVRLGYLF